jgi:hypothetical protein
MNFCDTSSQSIFSPSLPHSAISLCLTVNSFSSSLSFCLSLFRSLFRSLALSLSCSRALSLAHARSLARALSLSLARALSLCGVCLSGLSRTEAKALRCRCTRDTKRDLYAICCDGDNSPLQSIQLGSSFQALERYNILQAC